MILNIYHIKDLALKFHVSIITIRRLIKNKKIPFRRIGKRYFFTEDDIQVFLSSSAVPMEDKK